MSEAHILVYEVVKEDNKGTQNGHEARADSYATFVCRIYHKPSSLSQTFLRNLVPMFLIFFGL